MNSHDIEGVMDTQYLREKYPSYRYAIGCLDSEAISQRRLGYALLAPLFRTLPIEVKELIRLVWQNDPEKGKMPYTFVKCCKKIFFCED